jgi:hypothetical protein
MLKVEPNIMIATVWKYYPTMKLLARHNQYQLTFSLVCQDHNFSTGNQILSWLTRCGEHGESVSTLTWLVINTKGGQKSPCEEKLSQTCIIADRKRLGALEYFLGELNPSIYWGKPKATVAIKMLHV